MKFRFCLVLCLLFTVGGVFGSAVSKKDLSVEHSALLRECGLRHVDQKMVAHERQEYQLFEKRFKIVRQLNLALCVGVAGYQLYKWGMEAKSPSTEARLANVEAAIKSLPSQTTAPEKKENVVDGWLSSAKGLLGVILSGIGTSLLTQAVLGVVNPIVPIDMLSKAEPTYGWFLMNKTGFLGECSILDMYYTQQVVHEAFCLEVSLLVQDAEKVLGYVSYHIEKIRKKSPFMVQVLETRCKEFEEMTNHVVDQVACKQYNLMVGTVSLLRDFANKYLATGILA